MNYSVFHGLLHFWPAQDRNERNPFSESSNVGVLMGFGYTGYIGHTGGDPGVVTPLFFDPKSMSAGS